MGLPVRPHGQWTQIAAGVEVHGVPDGVREAVSTVHDPSQPFRHRNGLVACAGVEIDGDQGRS
jgi:flagellar basal body rod protein FlgC